MSEALWRHIQCILFFCLFFLLLSFYIQVPSDPRHSILQDNCTLLIPTKAASRGSVPSSMTAIGLQKNCSHSKPLFVDSVCSGVPFPHDFTRVQSFFFLILKHFQTFKINDWTPVPLSVPKGQRLISIVQGSKPDIWWWFLQLLWAVSSMVSSEPGSRSGLTCYIKCRTYFLVSLI